jgi:hypothetical protein
MKASALSLVLFVSVTACSRHAEPPASSDEGMQHKLAGVWVHEQTTPSGQHIVGTLEMAQGGTYTSILSLPARKVGPRRIESSGIWRIEDGFLIITETGASLTNFQGTNVMRCKILRVENHEFEFEFGGAIDGFTIPTNRTVFRKEAR